MGTPRDDGLVGGVVVLIVVDGQPHVAPHAYVAPILLVESVGSILKMACDIELASAPRHDHAHSALGRLGKQGEVGTLQDVLAADFRMAAMGHEERVVEATEDGQMRQQRTLAEDAEHLLLERIFRDAIVAVESCLGSPTDIHR